MYSFDWNPKTGGYVLNTKSARFVAHEIRPVFAEELKLVLSIAHPHAFMPVHGEASHLRAHAKLAEETGVPPENIFICENGDSLVLDANGISIGESVQSGVVYVDGLSVGDTSQDVLDERVTLGAQGFASVAAVVSMTTRKLMAPIALEMHGITGGDDPYVYAEAQEIVEAAIKKHLGRGATAVELKKISRDALLNLLWERTKQRPMAVSNILVI